MKDDDKILVERMSNLGAWEMFRFVSAETDETVCKVALGIDENADEMSYGVWKAEEEEPSATGSLAWNGARAWDDGAREAVLRKLVGIYEEGLPEVTRGLDFQIEAVNEDGDGEDEQDWELEDSTRE